MAELTAAYSPPMPRPVIIRKKAKLQKSQAKAHPRKVDDQCHVEDEATPEPVRDPAKSEGSRYRSGNIE
jgi:hypothetical protein